MRRRCSPPSLAIRGAGCCLQPRCSPSFRLWAAGGASAAETLQEKFDSTQGKLDQVRKSERSLSATIAEQNAAIDSMLGEVSVLRQRQAALESELADKQAELERASAKLEADKKRLAIVRARLKPGARGTARTAGRDL